MVFVHGFTAVDPDVYRARIEHIVRRGAVVGYPDDQTTARLETARDEIVVNAVDALDSALDELDRDS